MYRPVMVFKTFLVFLLLIMLGGIPLASAYPVSQSESGISASVLRFVDYLTALFYFAALEANFYSLASEIQLQGSTPTVTILPRDHESVPSETTQLQASNLPSTVVSKEVESDAEPSETSVSSDNDKASEGSDDGDGDEEYSQRGLNPNVVTGIALGVTFGVLLLIAAFMYAFRVGWEKGQRQKEKSEVTEEKQPPAPPTLEPWSQMDIIRPPDLVLKTGNSCWDSRSWSCCDEHTETYQHTGERYSFRPGMGVYEIRDSPVDGSQGAWSAGRTDSGLGLDYPENTKGKGREEPASE